MPVDKKCLLLVKLPKEICVKETVPKARKELGY
jgi:hypothetical protein